MHMYARAGMCLDLNGLLCAGMPFEGASAGENCPNVFPLVSSVPYSPPRDWFFWVHVGTNPLGPGVMVSTPLKGA